MKTSIFVLIVLGFFLVACQAAAPDQSTIQTAIAQTNVALPTPILPTVIPTQTPTLTPIPPTATIQPAIASIPGWKKFEGSGIELWLPESFEGGDLSQDLDVIVEKLKNLGPDYEGMAKSIEQNPSAFAMWAFDNRVGTSGFLTNVNITNEKVVSAITLEMYAEAVSKQLPASMTIVEQKDVVLDRYHAIRMVIEMAVGIVTAKEALYVIKNDNVVWAITYATSKNEYDQKISMFEQSANTFRVQP